MEKNKKAQPDICLSTAFLQQSPILSTVQLDNNQNWTNNTR